MLTRDMPKIPSIYLWEPTTKTIRVFSEYLSGDTAIEQNNLVDKLSVDTGFNLTSVNRYGKWESVDGDHFISSKYRWTHIPLDMFPDEFKLALLLLGVQ